MGVIAEITYGFENGGEGAKALAKAVVDSIDNGGNQFNSLYSWKDTVEEKIKTIATKIYGADGVEYSSKARSQLRMIKELGFDALPVCMAKTQKSLSDNEALVGRPTGFTVNVREFEFAAGAGFVIPILGDMMRMPGLPAIPASEHMDIDNQGKITGIS